MVETQPVTPARPVVVTLPAEIDMANAHQVRQQLYSALVPGVTVVVANMTATTFCDTMGFRALVLAHKRAVERGSELRLLITSPHVLRVMGILKVDTVLSIYSDLEAAVARPWPG
jgi:anti-anti-sigma factor